jgi:hypothetical protein
MFKKPRNLFQGSLNVYKFGLMESLYSQLTLYSWCRPAYIFDWKDFVGAKKPKSVGLLVSNPFCSG